VIEKICSTFAPSGCEQIIRDYIISKVQGRFDEISVDNLGNLICKNNNSNLCIECGMDTCGVMITAVKNDRAYFAGVGGINAEYLVGKKIVFKDGKCGTVRYDGDKASDSKISDLYLDIDTKTLKIGDFGAVKPTFFKTKNNLYANGIANRIGLAAVLKAIEKADKLHNISVVFSAQKRFGAKGIRAFFGVNGFDEVITIDGLSCNTTVKSGKGCCLVVADKAGICTTNLRKKIQDIFLNDGIKAYMVATEEDMCMGQIKASGKVRECIAIGVPYERKNNELEFVNQKDFENAYLLLYNIIEKL
jgi:endoglucanase